MIALSQENKINNLFFRGSNENKQFFFPIYFVKLVTFYSEFFTFPLILQWFPCLPIIMPGNLFYALQL